MGNTHDADVRALARNKRQICFHTLQTILYRCSNWLAAHYVGTVQMVEDLQTGPHVTYVIIGCVVPVSTKDSSSSNDKFAKPTVRVTILRSIG